MSRNYQNELQTNIGIKANDIISTLPEFTKKFFDHMEQVERSERTRLQYAYDLQRYFAFLSNQAGFKNRDIYKEVNAGFLDELEYDDIQEYLNTLNTIEHILKNGKTIIRQSSSAYKARTISTLRSFSSMFTSTSKASGKTATVAVEV